MKSKKTNYQLTFSYKAIITVNVKADNEEEAKKTAMKDFNEKFRLPGGINISIDDDNYSIQGVLNITETWDALYKK